jgi:hypothetical protein
MNAADVQAEVCRKLQLDPVLLNKLPGLYRRFRGVRTPDGVPDYAPDGDLLAPYVGEDLPAWLRPEASRPRRAPKNAPIDALAPAAPGVPAILVKPNGDPIPWVEGHTVAYTIVREDLSLGAWLVQEDVLTPEEGLWLDDFLSSGDVIV